ncbi:LOW QUALITY PROTEIN: pleiotropic drug resistance protein 3-like [Herrania umbratica]|uniref:LOW QUALITY PROTEIN: pleiotropic drug resistance protein 3-like n=1 Tax=Herrania umbratica TaxID=108875 RepID=A0A6J0ZMC6_9ROSI|nr:LOW QUALITY PROTEIN: pleiotropic drug resistance protein 3-like [Herrania umbratica]
MVILLPLYKSLRDLVNLYNYFLAIWSRFEIGARLVPAQVIAFSRDMRRGNEKTRIFSKKLQLLSDITGVARPGVLTSLMGPSGAGKTTLLDVLAGRKTIGCIEGEIRVGCYLKVQETFARISGYCELTDIRSPQIIVKESLIFSAWLCLPACIDSKIKTFGCKCCSIVMRAVKNVADTGRTIVCTIHQPSIDIFEAFDELIFLKTGGSLIYFGPLGQHSSRVVEYFESIPGVIKIKDNCNLATWMLEVTSTSVEAELGIDLAKIYKNSALYERNKQLLRHLSTPPPDSRDVHFPT